MSADHGPTICVGVAARSLQWASILPRIAAARRILKCGNRVEET
jgi:hypothetical protein